MKIQNFKVWLLIASSLFVVSLGITGELCLTNTSSILDHTSGAQAKFSTHNSLNTDKQITRNATVDNTSLSDYVSAISLGQLILDDPYSDKQWALSRIQAPKLWQVTTGDHGILVAILDTGVDKNHEDLAGKVAAEVNFTESPTLSDIHGHGTHIAGVIAATSNNGKGIAGLAPESRLLNVKVADDRGRCQASAVTEGIVWAVNNQAKIVNISLELKEPSPDLLDAIEYAWNQGALVIAAAGNDGNEMPQYPAYYENTIAVAASKMDDTLAPLSNYGDWVDVAAPGFNIYSTLPDDGYGYKSGTSFATAYVSGMAALLFSIVTDTNGNGRVNDEVRAAIEAGCQEIGISGVGKGRIDAAKSLDKID